MRIPVSVVVMSVVTAAPFALAIRDTLHDPHRGMTTKQRRVAEYEARQEREEAERARVEAEEKQEHEAADATLMASLIGAQPGELGSLFGRLTLGAPEPLGVPPDISDNVSVASAHNAMNVTFDADQRSVLGVQITLRRLYSLGEDYARCERFRDKLLAAWGPSSGPSWRNAETHHRATLRTQGTCALDISWYLDPADWIARVVPFDAIGKNAAAYAQQLGIALPDGVEASWRGPAVGATGGTASIVAEIARGRISLVRVMVYTDPATMAVLQDELEKKLGAPVPDPENADFVMWKGRVPVRFAAVGSLVQILIGSLD